MSDNGSNGSGNGSNDNGSTGNGGNGSNGGNGNGHVDGGNGKRTLTMAGPDPVASLGAVEGFPASEKIHVEDGELRVPVRRVHLSGGEPPFDVYDTSGPSGHDLHLGLPKLRAPWIARRLAHGDTGNRSQMHYARRGEITEDRKSTRLNSSHG